MTVSLLEQHWRAEWENMLLGSPLDWLLDRLLAEAELIELTPEELRALPQKRGTWIDVKNGRLWKPL